MDSAPSRLGARTQLPSWDPGDPPSLSVQLGHSEPLSPTDHGLVTSGGTAPAHPTQALPGRVGGAGPGNPPSSPRFQQVPVPTGIMAGGAGSPWKWLRSPRGLIFSIGGGHPRPGALHRTPSA
ncbi:unnamed protein product [Caretta caretta]